MIRAQLVLILLVGNKCAQLHGEVAISLGLDQRQLPVLNVDAVLLLEEIVDGDLSGLRRIGLISPVELNLLGIAANALVLGVKNKALDSILLLLINCCS